MMQAEIAAVLIGAQVQRDPAWVMRGTDDEIIALEIHAAHAIVVGVDADDLFQLIEALADTLQFFLHGGQGGLEFFDGDAHGG
jgi:hypothetical protein